MSAGAATAAATPVAGDHPWQAALAGLRGDALDCLQTTPALIADRVHGPDTHLRLGSRWRYPDAAGRLPEPTPRQRLAETTDLLGLRAGRLHRCEAAELRALSTRNGWLYVIADAYDLPWLPYAGRQHMAHSFLLDRPEDGPFVAVDAYWNDTEHGPARPGSWLLDDTALPGSVLATELRAGPPPVLDPTAAVAAVVAAAQAAEIDRYGEQLRDRLDRPDVVQRLVLDVWLLTRERLLRAAWLATIADGAELAATVDDWRRLATQTYVAMRRAGRGLAVGAAVVDDVVGLLHRDAELTLRLSAGDGVRDVVLTAAAEVLGVDRQQLDGAGQLRDLPGFSSFRLLDILDRVESRLGVQLPGDLPAADLVDIDGLSRLFTAAGPGSGR